MAIVALPVNKGFNSRITFQSKLPFRSRHNERMERLTIIRLKYPFSRIIVISQ
jgi:hypothetical protein